MVLESTGGWETTLVAALHAAAVPLAVVNPRQVRDFARATGRLAKTDRLDAQMLAHFAHACPPAPQEAAAPAAQELKALRVRRAELVVIRAGERSRLTHAVAVVRQQIDAHCTWLDAEIRVLDAALAAAIAARDDWRAQRALLESVPGVGPVMATTLLALVPELGHAFGQRDRGTDRGGTAGM